MYYSFKATTVYETQKNMFLYSNNYNSILETACKRIERKLKEIPIRPTEKSNLIHFEVLYKYEKTALEPFRFSEICCLYIINCLTSEIAPIAIYFVTDKVMIEPKNSERARLVAGIIKELGWGAKRGSA